MDSIPYYPGCTLNTVAKDFDLSARDAFRLLGVSNSPNFPSGIAVGRLFP